MISAQSDKLRERAKELRVLANGPVNEGFPAREKLFEAADAMCQAADLILELRDDLQQANAENAKLRDDLEFANNEWEKDSLEYLNLQAENAKLRELVADMLHDAMENVCSKAYWCDEKNWQTCNDKSCGCYSYVEIAHELGVEVDG